MTNTEVTTVALDQLATCPGNYKSFSAYADGEHVHADKNCVADSQEVVLGFTPDKTTGEHPLMSLCDQCVDLTTRTTLQAVFEKASWVFGEKHTMVWHSWWVYNPELPDAWKDQLLDAKELEKFDQWMEIDGTEHSAVAVVWNGRRMRWIDRAVQACTGQVPEVRFQAYEYTITLAATGKNTAKHLMDYALHEGGTEGVEPHWVPQKLISHTDLNGPSDLIIPVAASFLQNIIDGSNRFHMDQHLLEDAFKEAIELARAAVS